MFDMNDVIQRSIAVTRNGETLWPPPPVQVSAAPKPTMPAATAAGPTPEEHAEREHRGSSNAGMCRSASPRSRWVPR